MKEGLENPELLDLLILGAEPADIATTVEARVGAGLDAGTGSIPDTQTSTPIEVSFKDGRSGQFQHALFALGGSTSEGFPRQAGIAMRDRQPIINQQPGTGVPSRFQVNGLTLLLGALAALFVIYVAYRIGKVILRVFIGLIVLALLSWCIWSLFRP